MTTLRFAPFLLAAACGSAFAATSFVTTVQDAYPVPSPDGTRVAFQSNRSGTWELWTMQSDGTALRRLEGLAMGPSTPDWSPDGTRLVFAGVAANAAEGSTNALFVLELATSKVTRVPLPQATDIGHPKWSPDGGRIVFDSNHDTPDPTAPWQQQWQEVYSVTQDGSGLRRHTRCKTICTYAQLSPDGKQLLYRKLLNAPGFNWALGEADYNSEVFVADANGGNERNLTKHAAFDGWPSWAPDGKSIVFASARTGRPGHAGLYLVDVASGVTRRIGGEDRSFAQPRFARDGKSVWAYNNVEWTDEAGKEHEAGGIVRIDVP